MFKHREVASIGLGGSHLCMQGQGRTPTDCCRAAGKTDYPRQKWDEGLRHLSF